MDTLNASGTASSRDNPRLCEDERKCEQTLGSFAKGVMEFSWFVFYEHTPKVKKCYCGFV